MDSSKKLLKSTGIYFIGNVLSKCVSFLLLPLYTSYINPADYGYYDVSIAYLSILLSILFLDIWNGVLRFMFKEKNPYKSIYTGFAIFIISTICYIGLLLVANVFIDIKYFWLLLFYGLFQNLTNMYGMVARGMGKNIYFSISGVTSTTINLVTNIVLIVLLKFDFSSLYISYILGYIIQIVMLEIKLKLFKNFKFELIDKNLFKQMLKFSLPLCINSMSFWLLSNFNKTYVGDKSVYDAGIYAVAYKFPAVLTLISSCFSMAWQESAFAQNGTKKEKSIYFSKIFNGYTDLLALLSLLVLPLLSIVFPLFVNSAYGSSKILVPIFIIGTIFNILSSFLGSIFGNLFKTKIIFISTIIGGITNVLTTIILYKLLGLIGVTISFGLGFLVVTTMRIVLLKKDIDLKVNIKKAIIYFVLLVMFSYIFTLNPWINAIVFIITAYILFIIYNKLIYKMFNTIIRRLKHEKA